MAAGQGFKEFVTGEVLTAGDVNGYLMQGVLVFASAAARNAAITSPQEGQFAFTKDTNGLWYYDGAAWVASGATGDIEGVTAGVGISGGGTSGTVTITNSMATAIDAKGDLVAGTGADGFSRLAVGTNGQILKANSATATGLEWGAASAGKIIQVVSATRTVELSNSTSTYADTGLTATITPTSATSTILVMVHQNGVMKSSGNSGNSLLVRLLRGATEISIFSNQGLNSGTAINLTGTTLSIAYTDSPATTSATTYKTQFKNNFNGAFVTVQQFDAMSTITLIELGA